MSKLDKRGLTQLPNGDPQEKKCALRVLHGPLNIGNQPWVLSRAERKLGVRSDLVVRSGSLLDYPADRTLGQRGMHSYLDRVRLATFGMSSPFRYDVLHYYFGQSFMYWNVDRRKNRIIDRLSRYWLMFDVFLAKKLGRKIFMTLQGCDARLAYDGNLRNQWTMCESGRCPVYQTCIDKLDDDRRWLTTKILPICDRVFFLNPELGHVVPNGTFLPYSNVDIAGIEPVYPTGSGRPRIVHAPTNSEIKGTPLILNAVAKLKERYDFDFVLVQGATHQEAMEIYKSADIAIDQVLAGWYGGFAVEMMAMGKPVACYIRDLDMQFVPEALFEDLPVLRIHPDRLADDLEAILLASSTWSRIGERSRAFVEKWHDPEAIAEKMLSAYVDSHSTFKMSPKQAPTTI